MKTTKCTGLCFIFENIICRKNHNCLTVTVSKLVSINKFEVCHSHSKKDRNIHKYLHTKEQIIGPNKRELPRVSIQALNRETILLRKMK